MNGLLTDLYELIMAAGYFEAGKLREKATFELSIRRLPPNRGFVVAAGLPQVVEYLRNLRFTAEEIEYLRGLAQFRNASPAFFDYLRNFRFTGDLFAVPEGTPLFPGEPFLTLRAPIVEAQIPETYLLAAVSFQTLVATKAARLVEAAGGRDVVEFGTRRAHSPEAGVLAARAAYVGGCSGTSNTLAGMRYGIPVVGTTAHSWVMGFPSETEAFRQIQRLLGPATVQLVDTYDTLEGTRKAAALGRPLWGIRLDSGNFLELTRAARSILDSAGLTEARILLSGDLDEHRIQSLLAAGAPVDAFGVGTQLATSGDAPNLSAIYKLVEVDISGIKRFTAKYSDDKTSLPGSKQVFRQEDHDVLARSGECGKGEALLRPVLLGGELVEPLPDAAAARERAARSLRALPADLRRLENPGTWPVRQSQELAALIERTRRNLCTAPTGLS
ncbi:MAG TPA: nicotinate phosphoribosyltransferase [Bryobacteraceae bacterium]|nr:nicotinate phosphoribosyltransferase [Bryobacteraceae bacterium]